MSLRDSRRVVDPGLSDNLAPHCGTHVQRLAHNPLGDGCPYTKTYVSVLFSIDYFRDVEGMIGL